jgi:hypothetical protein
MSILDTFQKNFDTLKSEYTEYKDYHDTMITIIPNILELMDSLFLEENIKALPNYNLLKEDYLDVIKRTLEPDNYKDVKFEAELPDIYDAPRTRKEKAKKITKLKQKKVTTLPARVLPTVSATVPTVPTVQNTQIKPTTTISTPVVSPKISNEPKVDKAMKAYAEEGRRLYNYKSPLECQQSKPDKTMPEKVLIELPDETRAYLHNDGKIMDLKETRQLGNIAENGTVFLNNAEFGKINLVDRDEVRFAPMTNNFGKVLS